MEIAMLKAGDEEEGPADAVRLPPSVSDEPSPVPRVDVEEAFSPPSSALEVP